MTNFSGKLNVCTIRASIAWVQKKGYGEKAGPAVAEASIRLSFVCLGFASYAGQNNTLKRAKIIIIRRIAQQKSLEENTLGG